MQRPDIPFSFLSTQTCRNCQLAVTCGPVYVVNDLSILCGRCRMLAKDYYRNYAYEALASIFFYPCQNWRNHCPMKLRWNESLEHEKECNYIGCCTFFFSHPGAFLKGKRDIPHDETPLMLVSEELLDYIKCTLCEGYLNCSPVYIQSNGQNVCHRCVNANGHPPDCRRNHAYESFSQMFFFPCNYRNRGCTERQRFGMALWQHESQCDYGMRYKKKEPKEKYQPPESENTSAEQKPEKHKGLIKTQTGVIWATITPNSLAQRDDTAKQLVKSIVKKQQRHIRRADEVGNDMERRNSDSESVSTNDSYNIKSNASFSGNSTPEPLDSPRRPYIPPEDYNNRPVSNGSRPESRESGYATGPYQYPFVQQEELESHRGSIRNSLRPKDTYRDSPVAGNFPVLTPRHLSEGFESLGERGERYSHRESLQGNSLLISELKLKQDYIKRNHSIKGEQDLKNPTKYNNNLTNIQEYNRQYRIYCKDI